MAHILLTGGTGYIAAHTAIELIEQGHTPILLDNFVNSSPKVVERIEQITGVRPILIEMDILNTQGLIKVLAEYEVQAVIHFAALKAVAESVAHPLSYYHNNVMGFISVLQAMEQSKVFRIVLSSSATVYGETAPLPFNESSPALCANNPYGQTKVMLERIMVDVANSNQHWCYATLRYFNPVGAHPSGLMGEFPNGVPNNLMPFIQQVAVGLRAQLNIFGNDYQTKDGTCERDYIHVMDLARGHMLALTHILQSDDSLTVNLGAGESVSVLSMVKAFEQVTGVSVPFLVKPRRAGDVPVMCADVKKAHELLGFKTQLTVQDMCRDAWNWQRQNPNGYQ